jgi:hypothetical protein
MEQERIQLNEESVCNIELMRMSPEDNTRLALSTDGSRLIKSAHLRLEIQTETKPASVRYILEVPNWLNHIPYCLFKSPPPVFTTIC